MSQKTIKVIPVLYNKNMDIYRKILASVRVSKYWLFVLKMNRNIAIKSLNWIKVHFKSILY